MLGQRGCLDVGDSGWGLKVIGSYLSCTAGHGNKRANRQIVVQRTGTLPLPGDLCHAPQLQASVRSQQERAAV